MKKKLFIITFLTALSLHVFSQGCSDAGFCSLGALKNVSLINPLKNTIDFGFNFGYGEQKTLTYNPYLQYGFGLNDHFSVQGKLTATYATGFLGTTTDLGDAYGIVTYTPNKDAVNSIRFIGGIKVPLTHANDKNASGTPLPLDYQSSIGTYDLIAGANFIYHKHIEIDGAIQLPVIQQNDNMFIPELYTDTRIRNFPPTNLYRRKADLLIRLGYYFNLPASISIKPNLLAIYHLGSDSYQNTSNFRSPVIGTKGLTLNEGFIVTKQFKNYNQLELITAAPLIGRRVRADGLTRELVLNVQYSVSF